MKRFISLYRWEKTEDVFLTPSVFGVSNILHVSRTAPQPHRHPSLRCQQDSQWDPVDKKTPWKVGEFHTAMGPVFFLYLRIFFNGIFLSKSTMVETNVFLRMISFLNFSTLNFAPNKCFQSRIIWAFFGGVGTVKSPTFTCFLSSKSRGSPAARATISSFLNSTSLRFATGQRNEGTILRSCWVQEFCTQKVAKLCNFIAELRPKKQVKIQSVRKYLESDP